jgi:hypothetical protein
MSANILRLLLVIGWVVAQPLALLIGGWGLLGASYGRPGTSVIGLLLILLPTALLIAGLLGARRDPGHATLWLGLPLLGMAAGLLLALTIVGKG